MYPADLISVHVEARYRDLLREAEADRLLCSARRREGRMALDLLRALLELVMGMFQGESISQDTPKPASVSRQKQFGCHKGGQHV
jgi:hypothetical protein